MFKFSWFSPPRLNQRPKKVKHLGSNLHPTSQRKSKNQERKVSFGSASSSAGVVDNDLSNSSVEHTSSPSSHGGCWKSESLNADLDAEDKEFLQTTCLRKSYSLGSILDDEKVFSDGDATDDDDGEVDGLSFKYSHGNDMERINDLFDGETSPELYNYGNFGINFDSQHKKNDLVLPFDMIADDAHHDSLFSIEVLRRFDGNRQLDDDEQAIDPVDDSGFLSYDEHPAFSRPHSVSKLTMGSDVRTKGTGARKVRPRPTPFADLNSLNEGSYEFDDSNDPPEVTPIGGRAVSNPDNLPPVSKMDRKDSGKEQRSDISDGLVELHEMHETDFSGRFDADNQVTIDKFCSDDNVTSTNERREPETDGKKIKSLQLESSVLKCDELNTTEFRIRRIGDWISQIDNETGSIVEERGQSSCTFSSGEPQVEVGTPMIKADAKSNLGMEVAHNYISSLTAESSSAQMVNIGLTAVPLLSAFASLQILNLSGNSIVRISPGSLPRGLRMLNLSNNNITVIEGLRDLTHLRVLDLSYNRIVRIGHGLAPCSSLKELHLAGNKIRDVEGLHHLIKLSTLDLRSNRISTANGLSQLAANHDSLEAINLEGNPAQRNVGDEQLKKYLLSLLPNLVYYNMQAIKASGTKEISEHSPSRSVTRTDRLPQRRAHGLDIPKLARQHVGSTRVVNSPLKQLRGQNVESPRLRVPCIGSKLANYSPDTEKKPKVEGVLRANGALDRWENLVSMGLGGSMAAVLSHPPEPFPVHPHR